MRRTRSTTSANSGSTNATFVPESLQDELELGGSEAQVERVDDSGAEKPRVVQLEELVTVAGDDRVAVAATEPELPAQRGGEPEHALEMRGERRVVVAVVVADPVAPPLGRGDQQPREHELFSRADPRGPSRAGVSRASVATN